MLEIRFLVVCFYIFKGSLLSVVEAFVLFLLSEEVCYLELMSR